MSFDANEEISEKLDHVLAKVQEEPAPTGAAFRRLRKEMHGRYIETNQKVDRLEKSILINGKKVRRFIQTNTPVKPNIFTILFECSYSLFLC